MRLFSFCSLFLHSLHIFDTMSTGGDTMGKSSCEFCAYYIYNEYYDCYECMVNLDEDDVARFMQSSVDSCSYFKYSDDYKIVRKQN